MQSALAGLKGVRRAEVDLERGEARVELDGAASDAELVRAVEGKIVVRGVRRLLSVLPFGRRVGHIHHGEGQP